MSNLFGQDFFGYWVSFSVFMQCIVFISCSALADFGEQRKRLLAFFSIVGSLSTCLFWFVKSPEDRGLAVFLLVVSNVAFGASFVMYNAYLSPIAAGMHPFPAVFILSSLTHAQIMRTSSLSSIQSRGARNNKRLKTSYPTKVTSAATTEVSSSSLGGTFHISSFTYCFPSYIAPFYVSTFVYHV